MLSVTTLHSDAVDTEDVVSALTEVRDIPADAPLAGVLFASLGYDLDAIVAGVHARYPGIALVGCTANGTLSADEYHHDGVLLTLLHGPGLSFEVGVGRGIRADLGEACRAAVAGASRRTDRPSLVLTFADSLSGDMAEVVDRVAAAYGRDVPPIFGGSAADDWTFGGTSQIAGDAVMNDAVVALACYGPLVVSSGIAAGWRPIGPTMTVTDSAGALIRGIEGLTPREVLERHFPGFGVHDLLDHPLAVFPDPAVEDEFYLRALLAYDPESGFVTACGAVPKGAQVRLTIATSSDVLDAAVGALDAAVEGLDGPPEGVLVISCAARQTVLGIKTDGERAGIRSRLVEGGLQGVPIAGFYGYGEFGSVGRGQPRFHNETCVVLALRSADVG